jgi:hypothetical protein
MLKSQFRVFAQTALLLQFFTSPIEFDDFLSTPAFIGLQICAKKRLGDLHWRLREDGAAPGYDRWTMGAIGAIDD